MKIREKYTRHSTETHSNTIVGLLNFVEPLWPSISIVIWFKLSARTAKGEKSSNHGVLTRHHNAIKP